MIMNSMEDFWQNSQLEGENAAYLENLYEAYLDNPQNVPGEWRSYFDSLGANRAAEAKHSEVRDTFLHLAYAPKMQTGPGKEVDSVKFNQVMDLVNSYRTLGHYEAKIDPLNLNPGLPQRSLLPENHGLTEADLNQSWPIPNFSNEPLKNVIIKLKQIYCGSIGFEYYYAEDTKVREWLRAKIERSRTPLTPEQKKWLLQRMIAADGLEKYLGTRYPGQKRFGLDGGDSLIPMIDTMVHQACDNGVKEIVLAMAHRGRLNVLVNVLGKAPQDLFAEFEGKYNRDFLAGDVKYHNGFSSDIKSAGGMLHLSLAFNPSHLEIVSTVVEGSVHARQERRGNNTDQVLAIHTHGDAAFAGQGCVYEILNMSQTRGFGNGGAVHIVINNQVGFTISNPEDARSTYYCTDIAKMFGAPVFHVNGDDPEAVYFVSQLALEYRREFKHDVFIDLVCYRRHGHNESDEPSATQPLMYQVIKSLPVAWKFYADKLTQEGVIDAAGIEAMQQDYKKALEAGHPVKDLIPAEMNKKFISDWTPYLKKTWQAPYEAKLPLEQIKALGVALDQLPPDFNVQAQVKKGLLERNKMLTGELPVTWGYAETMAYATLLAQGMHIRLCGEDSGRGTFSHRHAVLYDQKTGKVYIPLDHVAPKQAKITIVDSILSEEAVMGFEYGYASSSPEALTIWEAQYGDFANGAQVIIDQFLCAGEEKWGRLCGLTLLLPHGQEGAGPEHSSARLERFLQLCANGNMQVCAPTTPAQIYHLLRRQVLRPFRNPLIIMSPKSILRHPLVLSTLDELANGQFYNVLPEQDTIDAKKMTRVVICQGKVYYDLLTQRREKKLENIALIRLEQMYPFPADEMKAILAPYAHVKDWVWCQEEPHNQGAWFRVAPDINALLPQGNALRYVGRKAYASPAVGYPSLFKEEQAALVAEAMSV
jgi:2-oxoglutarate dehydrogenase E1 component